MDAPPTNTLAELPPTDFRPFTADYHTNDARRIAHLNHGLASTYTDQSLDTRTFSIFLEVADCRGSVRKQVLATPIVIALGPNEVLDEDFSKMNEDIADQHFGTEAGQDDAIKEARWYVRWQRESAPDATTSPPLLPRTAIVFRNMCALVRFLKQRGGVNTIVLEWVK